MSDKIKVIILKDGTIKSTSDEISPANHSNAEAFLSQMAQLAGGEVDRQIRADVEHDHTHTHDDTHQH